jgi:hypothetical protein
MKRFRGLYLKYLGNVGYITLFGSHINLVLAGHVFDNISYCIGEKIKPFNNDDQII